MDENIKMFLRMIKENMNDQHLTDLETEAQELEDRLEKNQLEIEELQKQIAALSSAEHNGTDCEDSQSREQS